MHVKPQVKIRLLTSSENRYFKTLIPALELLHQQDGHKIEVRTAADAHERWLIIDSNSAYQSGASFKDGVDTKPATITQALDTFPAIKATYEGIWAKAKPEFDNT